MAETQEEFEARIRAKYEAELQSKIEAMNAQEEFERKLRVKLEAEYAEKRRVILQLEKEFYANWKCIRESGSHGQEHEWIAQSNVLREKVSCILRTRAGHQSHDESPIGHECDSLEQCEEAPIEENENCELVEENISRQAIEEEEKEFPEEELTVCQELEKDMTMGEAKEALIDSGPKETFNVDFVYGDELMMNSGKPQSLSLYFNDLWIKGEYGKGKNHSWKYIDKNFLSLLIFKLIYLAMIFESECTVMINLCDNLHDLKDLMQFAINPG